jgi:hypothetical protein
MRKIRKFAKQLRVIGGIHHNMGTVYFAVGDWFKFLGGSPDKGSVYVEILGKAVSR